MAVDALQQLPPGRAWLFYRSDKPLLVETRPAGLIAPLKDLSGYTPLCTPSTGYHMAAPPGEPGSALP